MMHGLQIGARVPLGAATLTLAAHYYDLSASQDREWVAKILARNLQCVDTAEEIVTRGGVVYHLTCWHRQLAFLRAFAD